MPTVPVGSIKFIKSIAVIAYSSSDTGQFQFKYCRKCRPVQRAAIAATAANGSGVPVATTGACSGFG
jgi:hypothetical protein